MKNMNQNYKKKEEFVRQIEVEDNFHFWFLIFFTLNYISANTGIRLHQICHLGQPKLANLEKIGIFSNLLILLDVKCALA